MTWIASGAIVLTLPLNVWLALLLSVGIDSLINRMCTEGAGRWMKPLRKSSPNPSPGFTPTCGVGGS